MYFPKLDRRRFIQGTAAAGASLIVPGRSLAATEDQPRRGGTVKNGLAEGSTSDSLDPGTYENEFMVQLAYATNNYLTEIDVDGRVKGEIAQGWESSRDAKTWTFAIRPDVSFHNGKPVTAEDVAASLNYHRGEVSLSIGKHLISGIDSVETDGKFTVKIALESGNADLPSLLSGYHFPIKPASEDGIDWKSGLGCGGYVLTSFKPGVSASLKRFPGYWKTDRAWFESVEFQAIQDPSARTEGLRLGELDLISKPDATMLNDPAGLSNIDIEEYPGSRHNAFAMRMDREPFDNPDVRQALKWSIDRQELVQKILGGRGVIGNDHPIGRPDPFVANEEELPQRSYDPDRAKFHLRRAGMTDLSVSLHVADAAFAGAIDAATLYNARARASGISIDIVREPNDGYWSNVWMIKDFFGVQWGGRPTPDMMFSVTHDRDGAWNETAFSDERFQQLLLAARTELDENRRREMYVEMQIIVSRDGGSLIPMFANHVWAKSKNLRHEDRVAGNWSMDGYRWSERWWLA